MAALEGTAHDHRLDKGREGVVLVVRSGNTYGGSPAGSRILVDERELRNNALRTSCMTIDEHAKLVAEREARVKAAENPEPPQITRIVEAGLKRLADQATVQEKPAEPIVDAEPDVAPPDDAAPELQLPSKKQQKRR